MVFGAGRRRCGKDRPLCRAFAGAAPTGPEPIQERLFRDDGGGMIEHPRFGVRPPYDGAFPDSWKIAEQAWVARDVAQ